MKYKNNSPLFSWCLCVRPWRSASGRDVAKGADSAKGRDLAPGRALVVNLLWVMGLWKRCTVSVPDFAVQMYRKVPQSTAKRVKKFGPESVADCRKVIATMMIRKVDEAAKKRFAGNAPQNPAFEIVR
jgi:hypothetical protein